ncbi:hypothetical protein [Alysiella crassa]|nr:hypothetical protein [Alysiella crassa]UOP07988.1 hypothetical protein LVJ80_06650 [Alysiella crassa]
MTCVGWVLAPTIFRLPENKMIQDGYAEMVDASIHPTTKFSLKQILN